MDEIKRLKMRITKLKLNKRFKNVLEELIKYLDDLNFLLSIYSDFIETNHKICFMMEILIESSLNTLNSIKKCGDYGNFVDCNILIRKFRDDLFMYLYILQIIKNPKDLSNDEYIKNLDAIKSWFDNEIEINTSKYYKTLDFNNYMKIILTNNDIKECSKKFNLENEIKLIGRNLNNYVHCNGIEYSFQRTIRISQDNVIIQEYDKIIEKIVYIISVFMTFLILIDPTKISSTDYMDYMDLGLEPKEESQYLVAPFINKFIEKYVIKIDPQLIKFLKYSNKYSMKIE